MKILIFGASGSGTSTLSRLLESKQPKYKQIESDDIFWLQTERPYTQRREVGQRNSMLLNEITSRDNVVVAGSIFHWDDVFFTVFDLVVFMYLPSNIRIPRLIARDRQRYGTQLDTDPITIDIHQKFIDWASNYDNVNYKSTNIKQHEDYINLLTTPIIRIQGDNTLDISYQILIEGISNLGLKL